MWMRRGGLCSKKHNDSPLHPTEYFNRLLSLFEGLPAYGSDFLSLAGRVVRLQTPSRALRARFLPALAHLLVDDDGADAALTIWYAEDKDLPGKVVAPPWHGFNAQGFHEGLDQEEVQLFFQPWQRQIFLYSRSRRIGIYWAQTARDVPWWESTFSFRILFHFWTRDLPAQLVHAGAVAKNGEAILITGPSGSGKSTSCLNLIRAGYQYLGDDYVWVELGKRPSVHTLYQTAKVEPDNLKRRFADWVPHVVNAAQFEQQKAIFYIGDLLPQAMIASAELKTVLLPRVADREQTLLVEAKASETLLAMAPTTLHHLPHHRQASYKKLREISTAVPGFRWLLGSDSKQFEDSLNQFHMNVPQVSVVIPTYQNGEELIRAVASATNQDAVLQGRCTLEIVVVNDAGGPAFRSSLDLLIHRYPQVTLINHATRKGPAAARNTGIKAASGDFVSFLDADDEWPADKLSLLLPLFVDPSLDVAGGKIKYVIDAGTPEPHLKYEDAERRLTHVHLGALLIRKRVFDGSFFFDETLRFSEDIDWWMRIKEQQTRIALLEATTLLYHVHGRNMSVSKTINELQLLRVLHRAAQRRQENKQMNHIPQLNDFRVHQEDPLISVILPLYNGKNLVGKSIESVLAQGYAHWELLVVDDGSTDGGGDYIRTCFPQATVIRQDNAGVAAARNQGIAHAKGDIIAFLDQDDEWLPTKLREQWEVLRADPYCAFVTCNQHFVCHDGVSLPANFSEKLLEAHRGLVPSALLIRKHVLQAVRNFDESLDVSSDFDLIRRLRKAGFQEKNVDRLLLRKWYHGSNASLNKAVLRKEILSLLHRQIKNR